MFNIYRDIVIQSLSVLLLVFKGTSIILPDIDLESEMYLYYCRSSRLWNGILQDFFSWMI